MNRRLLTSLLTTLVLGGAGCASDPAVRPTALDPSNPAAPESAPVTVSIAASPAARNGGAPHAHEHSGGREAGNNGSQTVTYTCPMHPTVRQPEPGTCPKCGMKLVPVRPEPQKKGVQR